MLFDSFRYDAKYNRGDFTLISADGWAFGVSCSMRGESFTFGNSLQPSHVFQDASETSSGKIVHFTDCDIERGVVIRAFLDLLSPTPPPLGIYPPIGAYVPLAQFLTKYDCPQVIKRLIARLKTSMRARRTRPVDVWAIGAVLENLPLCEAAVAHAVTDQTFRRPFQDWVFPSRTRSLLPWTYLAALEGSYDDATVAVGKPCKTDSSRTCFDCSVLKHHICRGRAVAVHSSSSSSSSDTPALPDSTPLCELTYTKRSFHYQRDSMRQIERGKEAAVRFM